MTARVLTGFFLLLASMSFGRWASAQQSPIPSQFCYDGRCYRTLAEAEADLRASTGAFGSYWRPDGVSQAGDGPNGVVLSYRYWIDDQPPMATGPLEYRVGGGDAYPTEEAGIGALLARLRNANPQCDIDRVGIIGSHGEPYVTVQASGRSGTVFNHSLAGGDPQPNKYVQIQTWCAEWSPPQPPQVRNSWIPKQYGFTCAEGFLGKEGSNPAYVVGAKGVDWPNICRPNTIPRVITGRNIKQTKSCEVVGNPCYPATGDKARVETDFIFAGQAFARHYHSLNQLSAGPEFGVGWSHSYADYIMRDSSRGTRVDDQGYLQTYSSGRGKQASREMLRAGSGDTSVLTQGDGTRRIYSVSGRLTAVETGYPATSVAVTYDTNSRIDRIVDGLGRRLQFAYVNRKLASITLPDGSQATYTYDPHGNLTRVVRPDGSSRTYVYGEAGLAPASIPNLMTGIIEGDVRYATFTYDANGMVTGSKLHAGDQFADATTIAYNPDGTATSVNALGDVRQHTIGVSGGQFSAITKTIDARGSHSYSFNSSGRLIARVDARGNQTSMAYADSSSGAVSQVQTISEESIGRITRTTRDASNFVVEERVTQKASGLEQLVSLSRFVPDPQGRTRYTCQYDASLPTDYICGSMALAPGNVRQTTHTYCTEADAASNSGLCPLAGLRLSTRDPAGSLTQFDYYSANDPGCESGTSCTHRKGDMRAQINAIGQRTEILEYDGSGNAIRILSEDGTETERLYDSMGRMVTETLKGDMAVNDRISLFEFSSTGKMIKITRPDGVWTAMHYDTADRLKSVEDALGNRIVYSLDGAGNRVKEEINDSAGTLRKVLNRTFDFASRNTRIAGADGHAVLLRYDGNGNVLETEDALGSITKQGYDGVDRIITEVKDLGGINAQVGYEYAGNGQIAVVTDPKGLRTTYAYNGFGDLLQQVSPDTGITTFTVDAVGNRTTSTDARGITATYQYDALNRVTHISYPDPTLDVAYTYDTVPAVCAANEQFSRGRVGTVIHAGGSTQYCHDRFGQLTRKVQTVNGVATTVRYGYTAGGRLATLTYPDGTVADYLRDSLGRISEVGVTRPGQARQVVVTNVTYAPFGPATGWTYGNGRTLQRPVDQDYRTIAVHDPAPGGLSVGYGYDAVGDITELTNGDGTEVLAQYSYDALGRLTQTKDGATGTPIETYGYDATGNRTELTTNAGTHVYSYPADSHRLTAVDAESRAYDPTGNTLNIGSREYVYSDANRLTQVKQGGAVAESYVYNHRGERIGRSPSGAPERYSAYDEVGQWLGDISTSGQAAQQVIWLDRIPVALVGEQPEGTSKLAYIQSDHLGTPRLLIDPTTGASLWEWSSKGEVFGSQAPNIDPAGNGASMELALRFPGQQATVASALYYNNQREYDATTGRYSQSDPIGLRGGSSTYSYVGSSPLRFVDPLGLVKWRGYAHGIAGGGGGLALAFYNFHLTSECVGGRMAIVDLDVFWGGGGLGAPVTYTVSNVTLDDGASQVDPNNLTGPAVLYGGGFAAGGGASYSELVLGSGRSDLSWSGQGGWDASLYAYPYGRSRFDGQPRIINCGCER